MSGTDDRRAGHEAAQRALREQCVYSVVQALGYSPDEVACSPMAPGESCLAYRDRLLTVCRQEAVRAGAGGSAGAERRARVWAVWPLRLVLGIVRIPVAVFLSLVVRILSMIESEEIP